MYESDDEALAEVLHCIHSVSAALASTLDVASALPAVGAAVIPAFADGLAILVDDEPAMAVGRLGVRPALDLPLAVRGARFGTLQIARSRPLDNASRTLFEIVALRIAVAVDLGRIATASHRVADTLQRALLPERLPVTDRHRFDAAYLPGTAEAIVGGDWYDAFALPDGRVALSIGDVAGHGLSAAIVMGEVRHAFRAAALGATLPSAVLERANAIVNMRAEPVMVTAIFGFLDPVTSTLTYAVAGHPSPVLALPDTDPEKLPAGGIPLGIASAVDAPNWTFTIAPGAALMLYTDGLIEHDRDVVAGEVRLLEAVAAEVARGSSATANGLVTRVLGGAKNTDDTVALLLAADDVSPDEFFFEFSSVPLGVPLARRALRRYAERQGFTDDTTFALLAAIGEAMANAVEHAYGDDVGSVRVRVAVVGGTIHATVEDDGRWKAASKREERGRGLPLMRALCDGVEIHTNQVCTAIQLRISA